MEFIPQSRIMRTRAIGKVTEDGAARRAKSFRATQELLVVAAFRKFVTACQSDATVEKFKELFETSQYAKAVDVTLGHVEKFAEVIETVFINSGNWQNREGRKQLEEITKQDFQKAPRVDVTFDPGDAAAARAMQESTLEFIREIGEAQRKAIREALTRGLAEGMNPTEVARLFRDNIGLTEFQMKAVENYRNMLNTGNSEALNRALRDRRFDSTVNRAINNNTRLTTQQVDRMVDRYKQRMLDMRAETIARTETQAILSRAQHESMIQMAGRVGMEMDRIERTWRTIIDGRQRDTHGAMNNQRRTAEEWFVSPSGARLMFPGDRRAPAAEVINCRCVLLIRFKELSEMADQQQNVLATEPTIPIPGIGRVIRHPDKDYHIPVTDVTLPGTYGRPISQFPVYPEYDAAKQALIRATKESMTRALTTIERDALTAYTGTHYSYINKGVTKYLRSGVATSERQLKADAYIKAMDSAFTKAELSEDITVYRSMGKRAKFDRMFPDLKEGEFVVFDKAYGSTSLSKDIAKSFSYDYDSQAEPFIFKILLPKGSKVIPMGGVGMYWQQELEFVINRGAVYVVREIEKNMITIELVST